MPVMKDYFSPRAVELWQFTVKLRRIGLPPKDIIKEATQYSREAGDFRGRGSDRPDSDLNDLIISIL